MMNYERTAIILLAMCLAYSSALLNTNMWQRSKLANAITRDTTMARSLTSSDFIDDPYADMLDFNARLADNFTEAIVTENTIVETAASLERAVKLKQKKEKSLSKKAQRYQWVHWNDFLEEQLGDMDAELQPGEEWVGEMRDAVELKRGYAIWSDRTEQDIAKEQKKSLASKGVVIPSNVAMVITAVHLDKVCTMKELAKEEEIACAEYRKWMREQRKKQKKDPLPMAKTELTKQWLQRHPSIGFAVMTNNNNRMKFSTDLHFRKPPMVVLDEITQILEKSSNKSKGAYGSGTFLPPISAATAAYNNKNKGDANAAGSASSPSSSSSSASGSNGIKSYSSQNAPLSAPSVVNWFKSAEELVNSVSNPSGDEVVARPLISSGYGVVVPGVTQQQSAPTTTSTTTTSTTTTTTDAASSALAAAAVAVVGESSSSSSSSSSDAASSTTTTTTTTGASAMSTNSGPVFQVDDVSMYVANNLSSEDFFVVL